MVCGVGVWICLCCVIKWSKKTFCPILCVVLVCVVCASTVEKNVLKYVPVYIPTCVPIYDINAALKVLHHMHAQVVKSKYIL